MGYEQQQTGANPPAEQWTAVPTPPDTDVYCGEVPGAAPPIQTGFHYEHGSPNTSGAGMGNKSQNDGGL